MSSCSVAVTEFMDVTIMIIHIYTYIMIIQNAKSWKIFKYFVVQGQGLVNWSSRIFEDKDFPEVQ